MISGCKSWQSACVYSENSKILLAMKNIRQKIIEVVAEAGVISQHHSILESGGGHIE